MLLLLIVLIMVVDMLIILIVLAFVVDMLLLGILYFQGCAF